MKKETGLVLFSLLILSSLSVVQAVPYDFGGMYYKNILNNACIRGNPATTNCSCPNDYTSVQTWGFDTIDNSYPNDNKVFYCYREHQEGRNGFYDFGGMFSNRTLNPSCLKLNPATNACSCPQGYGVQQLTGAGGSNLDLDSFYCYRNYTGNAIFDFGGMIGTYYWADPLHYAHIETRKLSCPANYTRQLMTGWPNWDWNLYFCYKNSTTVPDTAVPESHLCSDSSQVIMRLEKQNNSLASLWDYAGGYNYEICYDEIFGPRFTGASVHNCSGSNTVISLASNTSSLASSSHSPSYPVDVCYGDLQCRAVTGSPEPSNCRDEGYEIVVSLSRTSGSNISARNFVGYPIKICCKNATVAPPAGESYWTNLRDIRINKTSIGDSVKLNVLGSGVTSLVNYTIYKKCEGILCWLPFIGDVKTAQASGYGFTVWQANEAGSFYFKAKVGTAEYDSKDTPVYGILEVTAPASNFPPVAVISAPNLWAYFLTRSSIQFQEASYDEDDSLDAVWDFGDGNTTTKRDCNAGGNCNTTHEYLTNGAKLFSLTARESARGGQSTAFRTIYLFSEGLNFIANITSPTPNSIIRGAGVVAFNGSQSFVANCSNCTSLDICPQCPVGKECFNVTGEIQGQVQKKICWIFSKSDIGRTPGKYNLWFNWTFDDNQNLNGNWIDDYSRVADFNKFFSGVGEHWAKLKVGYESF